MNRCKLKIGLDWLAALSGTLFALATERIGPTRLVKTLPPRTKRQFTYIITRYHGERQERAPKN